MKKIILLVVAVGFLSSGKPQAADNWPHWRGPLANGFVPGGDPPVKWDEKTNVRWRTPIPGKGSSTPIVWGERIFVLTAIDTGREAAAADLPRPDPGFERIPRAPTTYYQFIILCLDRNSGQVLWKQVATEQVPHEGHHPTHSYAAYSPTTDGQRLYASFGSRGVYCYDFDGKLLWKRNLGRMNTRLGWGEGASPVIHGDTLVLNWDQEKNSFIIALDAKTGQTRWKVDRDEATTWATPLVAEHKGRTQVITMGTKLVRSYDLATGELIWQCGGHTVNCIPSPLRYRDTVICVSGYKGHYACAVPLDAKGDVTGKVLWEHKQGTPYVPSPVLAGERLYFTQFNMPVLTCLDAQTGKPLIDRQRLPGLETLYASPVCAGGRLYFCDREGNTLVLKQSDRVEVLALNRLGEAIDASPVVLGKQLLLRGEKHLYCIRVPSR
jgi:outer membrane protein assembly factor BamB